MVVGGDLDVLEMFKLFAHTCQIDLYVELSDVLGPLITAFRTNPLDACPSNVIPTVDEVLHVEPISSTDDDFEENVVDLSKEEVEWSDDSDDPIYDLDNEIDSEVASGSDGMSDYQCEDDARDTSSSDDDLGTFGPTTKAFDPSKYGVEFHVGEHGKIKLAKGLLFENVDKFREALRDYTIQEGCTIVRLKNEKSRVTCECAALDCNWRVHASPLPDGVTYMIKSYNGEHTCLSGSKSVEANSTWIAKKLAVSLRANFGIRISLREKWLLDRAPDLVTLTEIKFTPDGLFCFFGGIWCVVRGGDKRVYAQDK
ncbi:hypothetical protein Vadar_009383 [Vaccinium darrowii]|uniref:Uncharacterized protein n=1 Tax=Vaccinium darrowii TaxID=229202 RepID=A0ACB7YDQ8_9ERIC|nr:hypothetical protein Vadar_009383 [Vaccinium darrowii]